MDQADEELRDTIRSIWPIESKKMLNLLLPNKSGKNNVSPEPMVASAERLNQSSSNLDL